MCCPTPWSLIRVDEVDLDWVFILTSSWFTCIPAGSPAEPGMNCSLCHLGSVSHTFCCSWWLLQVPVSLSLSASWIIPVCSSVLSGLSCQITVMNPTLLSHPSLLTSPAKFPFIVAHTMHRWGQNNLLCALSRSHLLLILQWIPSFPVAPDLPWLVCPSSTAKDSREPPGCLPFHFLCH